MSNAELVGEDQEEDDEIDEEEEEGTYIRESYTI